MVFFTGDPKYCHTRGQLPVVGFDLEANSTVARSPGLTAGFCTIRAALGSLLEKILFFFDEERYFLKHELTIEDVAQKIGTNRTYVSKIINEYSGQNFCSFVNQYRVKEMMRLMESNNEIPLKELAETSGFGSVDSMKRAALSKTGMSFKQLRIQNKDQVDG